MHDISEAFTIETIDYSYSYIHNQDTRKLLSTEDSNFNNTVDTNFLHTNFHVLPTEDSNFHDSVDTHFFHTNFHVLSIEDSNFHDSVDANFLHT